MLRGCRGYLVARARLDRRHHRWWRVFLDHSFFTTRSAADSSSGTLEIPYTGSSDLLELTAPGLIAGQLDVPGFLARFPAGGRDEIVVYFAACSNAPVDTFGGSDAWFDDLSVRRRLAGWTGCLRAGRPGSTVRRGERRRYQCVRHRLPGIRSCDRGPRGAGYRGQRIGHQCSCHRLPRRLLVISSLACSECCTVS